MLRPHLSRQFEPELTELGLRNFKAFGNEDQLAPMSQITLIYGPNSGGKSSVIQALLLLKQSEGNLPRAAVLAPRGEFVDLAGFKAMVHRHNEDDEVEIKVKLRNRKRGEASEEVNIKLSFGKDTQHQTDLPVLKKVAYELKHHDTTDLSIRLKKNTDRPQENQATATFTWDDEGSSIESYGQYLLNLLKDRRRGDRRIPRSLLTDLFPHLASIIDGEHPVRDPSIWGALTEIDVQARSSVLPSVIAIPERGDHEEPSASSEFRNYVARFMGEVDTFPAYLQDFLDSMSYLGPILDDPRRYYLSWGGQRSTVGKRGEYTSDIISYEDAVRNEVNKWFARFDIPYQIQNKLDVASGELTGELSAMPLRDTRTETIVTPVDVGFGISQILPVIVEAVAGTSRTVCVDQPEVHLHPRLQAQIADLMIETSKRQNKRWIVETHSELLVLRIQTAIAEGRLEPSDVSILYVNPPPTDALTGEGSTIEVLKIDEYGDFTSAWPEGFFEDGHEERIARLRAGG